MPELVFDRLAAVSLLEILPDRRQHSSGVVLFGGLLGYLALGVGRVAARTCCDPGGRR